MREVSARISSTSSLVVNAVNPGLCMSEIMREARQNFIIHVVLNFLLAILARTAEEGGRVLVHAAVSTKPEDMLGKYSTPEKIAELEREGAKAAHGKFFHTCRISEESDFVISEEGRNAQKRVWVSSFLAPDLYIRYVNTFPRMKL